jgi:hypothetical protein
VQDNSVCCHRAKIRGVTLTVTVIIITECQRSATKPRFSICVLRTVRSAVTPHCTKTQSNFKSLIGTAQCTPTRLPRFPFHCGPQNLLAKLAKVAPIQRCSRLVFWSQSSVTLSLSRMTGSLQSDSSHSHIVAGVQIELNMLTGVGFLKFFARRHHR